MNPIIVVGTGRSGTSMTSKILMELGVYMGEEFVPEDENNPNGHWEDLDFYMPNELFLKGRMDIEQWKRQITWTINKRKEEGHLYWGWKDPRTSKLIKEYKKLLIEPTFVWCTRDQEDTVSSMVKSYKNGGHTMESATKQVVNVVDLLEKELEGHSVLEIKFADLLNNPTQIVAQINDFLGIDADVIQLDNAIKSVRRL